MTDTYNGQLIRLKQIEIMVFLYYVRGATNEQLRRYLYSHCNSKRTTQLANTSKFVSELKKNGFINSVSCHPHSKGELNFLTSKAITYLIENERIMVGKPEGNEELGFAIEGTHGEFEYSMLKPPTRYIEHHMMTVDLFLDYKKIGRFRNNLYCARTYKYKEEKDIYERSGKLRPDSEFISNKGAYFTIEIDTGSERYKDLVIKFENYKRYFDYCLNNDLKIPYVGIIFHTKKGSARLSIKDDKRWQTICKAAVEGFSYYCWTFHLLGFSRPSLAKLLKEETDLLNELGIDIPPSVNPIVERKNKEKEEEKRRLEEEKRRKAESERKRQEEAERKRQLEIKKEKERQMRLEAERQRIFEEEEKKKKGLFGKFFG